VQRQLDEILPGYRVLAATAHDWLADRFSSGTWAIHWAGFIDGAIESGLRSGAAAVHLSG
jgi:hypothetical protein